MPERYEGLCYICMDKKLIRNIDLYVIGSEGLNICHACEMWLVETIRETSYKIGQIKKKEFLEKRALTSE